MFRRAHSGAETPVNRQKLKQKKVSMSQGKLELQDRGQGSFPEQTCGGKGFESQGRDQ